MDSLQETIKELEGLKLGEHLCCIYRDKEEQLATIIPFMSIGFARNEKCIYIVDESTKENIIEAFRKDNTDIESYIQKGNFEFLTKSETYLKDGYFDPEKMIGLLKQAQEEALNQGYSGLRITGEMTWIFNHLPGSERLIEYESKLNYFLPASKCIALCQYNESRFKPDILIDVIHTHPEVIIYNNLCENPYFITPDEFLARMKGITPFGLYERIRDDIIKRAQLERARKEIEEALRNSLEYWNMTFNAMGDSICLIDLEGKIMQCNKAMEKLLDKPSGEIIGRRCWELVHGTQVPIEDCPIKRMAQSHKRETLALAIGERWLDVSVDPLLDKDGKLIGGVHVISDITERKKAVREREALSERNEALVTALGQIVYEWRPRTNEIIWSKEFTKVLGYSPQEIGTTTESWTSRVHPDDLENVLAEVENATRERRSYNLEYRFRHRDGSYRWMLDRGVLFIGPHGELEKIIGVFLDITERKQIELARTNLLRDVSHELRTPISITEMAIELNEEGIRKNNMGQIKKAQQIASRNIKRIHKDVDNMLELVTLDIRKMIGKKKKKVSLKAVLNKVIEDSKYLAEEKRLKLKINIPEKAGKVALEERDLRVILANLIDNSLKFTRKGGISISSGIHDNWVEIKVKDTGCGIEAKCLDKVFDKFFKRHLAVEGLGLGLPIAKEIVEVYGGKIEVRSEGEGKGTEVVIRLPKA